jgi:hypothetical protein
MTVNITDNKEKTIPANIAMPPKDPRTGRSMPLGVHLPLQLHMGGGCCCTGVDGAGYSRLP